MMKNLLNVYYDEKTSIDNINPVPFHLLTKLTLFISIQYKKVQELITHRN